jgi:hypothetical protein
MRCRFYCVIVIFVIVADSTAAAAAISVIDFGIDVVEFIAVTANVLVVLPFAGCAHYSLPSPLTSYSF